MQRSKSACSALPLPPAQLTSSSWSPMPRCSTLLWQQLGCGRTHVVSMLLCRLIIINLGKAPVVMNVTPVHVINFDNCNEGFGLIAIGWVDSR